MTQAKGTSVAQARNGDRVQVHYTGRLDDETEFDSSAGGEPLEFTIGEGSVIPGFEAAVEGMNVGDRVDVRIEAAGAYGERMEEMVFKVDRAELPSDLELELEQELHVQTGDGHELMVTVAGLDESHVILDGNHPLAGETLTFQIELVAIL